MKKLEQLSLEQLRIQANEIKKEIFAREEAEFEARRTDLLKYVGKCFKRRNNYSCPQKPSDYWWQYVRIIKLRPQGFDVVSFQIDKDGHLSAQESYEPLFYPYAEPPRGIPISLTEYKRAQARAVKFVKYLV